ncbi:MAG: DUF5107 domain-containing protein [Phycisphaerae bacterium]
MKSTWTHLLAAVFVMAVATSLPARAAAPASADTSKVKWSTVQRVYPVRNSNIDKLKVKNVILQNEYLKIEIAPDLAGRIMRVTYADGTELFNVIDEVGARIPWDCGGWRTSFPFYEHGMRFKNQECGWRVLKQPDGSVTLAMNNRFSRFRDPGELNYQGRFTHLRLGREITLRPGQAFFSCRMNVENLLPYRVGYRLWTTAQYPVAADGEFVFPVSRMVFHRAERFCDWPKEGGLADYKNWNKPHYSFFAVGMDKPFVAVFYPKAKLNRIRIADPEKAPGAKLFGWGDAKRSRFFEIWTGSDALFEEEGQYIQPFEIRGFTEYHFPAKGIGKVDFANRHLAVGVQRREQKDQRTALIRLTPAEELRRVSIRATGSSGGDQTREIGLWKPGQVIRLTLPMKKADEPITLDVSSAGNSLLKQQAFPLQIPARDAEAEKAIRRRVYPDQADQKRFARHCELRGWVNYVLNSGGTPTLQNGFSAGAALVQEDPTDLESLVLFGRIAHRLGRSQMAQWSLRMAVRADSDSGLAHHLLGLVLLENGGAAEARKHFAAAMEAKRPHAPAGYFLALQHIADNEHGKAVDALKQVRKSHPNLLRPAVTLASTLLKVGKKDEARNLISKLVTQYPASLEAAAVCARCHPEDTSASQALKGLKAEPESGQSLKRFFSEIDDGKWIHPPRPEKYQFVPHKKLQRTDRW